MVTLLNVGAVLSTVTELLDVSESPLLSVTVTSQTITSDGEEAVASSCKESLVEEYTLPVVLLVQAYWTLRASPSASAAL